MKSGVHVISLDEYEDTSTHWVALFCNKKQVIYFDSFVVEHVPEKLKRLSEIKTSYQIFFEYNQTIQ